MRDSHAHRTIRRAPRNPVCTSNIAASHVHPILHSTIIHFILRVCPTLLYHVGQAGLPPWNPMCTHIKLHIMWPPYFFILRFHGIPCALFIHLRSKCSSYPTIPCRTGRSRPCFFLIWIPDSLLNISIYYSFKNSRLFQYTKFHLCSPSVLAMCIYTVLEGALLISRNDFIRSKKSMLWSCWLSCSFWSAALHKQYYQTDSYWRHLDTVWGTDSPTDWHWHSSVCLLSIL